MNTNPPCSVQTQKESCQQTVYVLKPQLFLESQPYSSRRTLNSRHLHNHIIQFFKINKQEAKEAKFSTDSICAYEYAHTCARAGTHSCAHRDGHMHTGTHVCIRVWRLREPGAVHYSLFLCLSLDRNSPRRVGSDANLPASRVKLVPTCLQGKHSTGAISPAPSTFSSHTHYFCFSGNPSRSFPLIYWRIICEEENWMGETFRVGVLNVQRNTGCWHPRRLPGLCADMWGHGKSGVAFLAFLHVTATATSGVVFHMPIFAHGTLSFSWV